MSITTLPQALQGPISQAADVLRKGGASRIIVFGTACSAYQAGNDVQIAVSGLDDDHLLKATGRIMMDFKLSVDLCQAEDAGSDFAKAGSKGIEI